MLSPRHGAAFWLPKQKMIVLHCPKWFLCTNTQNNVLLLFYKFYIAVFLPHQSSNLKLLLGLKSYLGNMQFALSVGSVSPLIPSFYASFSANGAWLFYSHFYTCFTNSSLALCVTYICFLVVPKMGGNNVKESQ